MAETLEFLGSRFYIHEKHIYDVSILEPYLQTRNKREFHFKTSMMITRKQGAVCYFGSFDDERSIIGKRRNEHKNSFN
jgi:hypothetical protein